MNRALAMALVLTAGGSAPAAPPRPDENLGPNDGAQKFVRLALFHGLAEDGVPPALAKALAGNNGDFIPKCSICGPTRQVLAEYGKLTEAPAAKEGKGLGPDLERALQSDKDDTRRAALRELVQRYIEREYKRLDLPVERRAGIEKELAEMRKGASGLLPAGQKFCPSCDGACRLTPKL